ncbi:hypothetical protein [Butyrivibrio sp. JL13D10]|uniref:hypothetical protein n=1 Tax=Butyrivibrio sp. JL13D10 TaxID=3236815 RepID=UPI0038B66EE9
MDEFIERIKTDEEFRHELRDFLAGKTDEMNEIINEYNKKKDKLVVGVIREFAADHNMTISESEESRKKSHEICESVHKKQVDEYGSALKMLFS